MDKAHDRYLFLRAAPNRDFQLRFRAKVGVGARYHRPNPRSERRLSGELVLDQTSGWPSPSTSCGEPPPSDPSWTPPPPLARPDTGIDWDFVFLSATALFGPKFEVARARGCGAGAEYVLTTRRSAAELLATRPGELPPASPESSDVLEHLSTRCPQGAPKLREPSFGPHLGRLSSCPGQVAPTVGQHRPLDDERSRTLIGPPWPTLCLTLPMLFRTLPCDQLGHNFPNSGQSLAPQQLFKRLLGSF